MENKMSKTGPVYDPKGLVPVTTGMRRYHVCSEDRPRTGCFILYHDVFTAPVLSLLSGEFTRREAFLWMIFKSADELCIFEFRNGASCFLEQGELIVSLQHMAKEWGWEQLRVRAFLSQLEREALIKQRINECDAHIVTICDYDIFQPCYEIKGDA